MKPLRHPMPQLFTGGGLALALLGALVWVSAAQEQSRLRTVNDVAVAMFGSESYDPRAGEELTWGVVAGVVAVVLGLSMLVRVAIDAAARRP